MMASPLTWYFPVILVPVIFGYCKMLLLCVCVCYHICRYVCAQVRHISVFLFPVLMTWKKCHTAPFIAVVCVTHLILPNCLLLALQTERSDIFQCGLGDAGSKIDGCLLLSL